MAMFFFNFWIGSILFIIVALLLLFNSKWRRAALYGLAGFFLFLLLGTYAIFQTRSSTAALGFIFLPTLALVPGFIGIALGKFHAGYLLARQTHKPTLLYRFSMVIFGVLFLVPFIWQGYALFAILSKNKVRDNEQNRQSIAITNNTKELDDLLARNPGDEANILSKKATQTNDRTILIPIAESAFASMDLLDTLSRSTDWGVVSAVVWNKNTSSKTLELIYKNHSYPSYFYMGLSSNPHTPDRILRELYKKRNENGGIAWNLARNLSLPDDILNELTHESDKYVLRDILNRPHLSRIQVNNIINTANTIQDNDVAWLLNKAKSRMEDYKKKE
jgi:hypothetical protein